MLINLFTLVNYISQCILYPTEAHCFKIQINAEIS
jgi:hypothetical protein